MLVTRYGFESLNPNAFTASWFSDLVPPEMKLNLQICADLKIRLVLEAEYIFDPTSTIVATDFVYDLAGRRELKLLLKC